MIKKILALFLTVLFAFPIPAFAHGETVQATPATDSNILTAPIEVSIEFDGKLQIIGNTKVNLIEVKDNQGQLISSPVSVVEGNKISTRLQLTDITGLVSVHYRIVSEDGHPVEGDYSFTVGETPMLTSAQGERTPTPYTQSSKENNNVGIYGVALLTVGLVFVFVRRIKK